MIWIDALVRRSRLYRAAGADLVRSAEARDSARDEVDRLKCRVDESSSTGTIATFAVDNATHITRAVDLTAGGGDCTNAVYSVRIVLKRVI